MAKCPHDCNRCRAIEAGYGGRALTRSEFLDFHELIVPAPSSNGWSSETNEARLAVELAEVGFAEKNQALVEAIRALAKAPLRRGEPMAITEGGRILGQDQHRRDLQEAVDFAKGERDRAAERLKKARVTYQRLNKRDSLRRQQDRYEEGQASLVEQRSAQEEARRDSGHGTLERIRGRLGGE